MKLIDMQVEDYLMTLKSDAPAPGGGAASAIAGAQGAALVIMVCELTMGKEKFAEYEEKCKTVAENMERVYAELLKCVDEDTEAFNKVAKAFKLPKESEEEKRIRSEAIGVATIGATEVPFKIMELGLEGLRLAGEIVGKSNPTASSDIGVGALSLRACVLGAWLNVKINLPGIKNDKMRQTFEEEGGRIVFEATSLADRCYKRVLEEF